MTRCFKYRKHPVISYVIIFFIRHGDNPDMKKIHLIPIILLNGASRFIDIALRNGKEIVNRLESIIS